MNPTSLLLLKIAGYLIALAAGWKFGSWMADPRIPLRWAEWLRARLHQARPPDKVIGEFPKPYLLRWHLIPRNRLFNAYLHHFERSDDDRALHDHPWLFNVSIILSRDGYLQHTIDHGGVHAFRHYPGGSIIFRWGAAPHRIQLHQRPLAELWLSNWNPLTDPHEQSCDTLFITGPLVRMWGFHCPRGWVPFRKFTTEDGNRIGKGCDQ